VPSFGGTLQFTSIVYDTFVDPVLHLPGHPMFPQPTITWRTSNSTIATINSSGLATGTGQGICTITAATVISGAVILGTALFGVACISPAAQTMNFGAAGVTFSCTVGNGFATPGNHDGGNISQVVTVFEGGNPQGFPSSLVVPIYCYVNGWQGVVAQANLTVNNIP